MDEDYKKKLLEQCGPLDQTSTASSIPGAVFIDAAMAIDECKSDSWHAQGPFVSRLTRPTRFRKPIPCPKGNLGCWHLDPSLSQKVSAALQKVWARVRVTDCHPEFSKLLHGLLALLHSLSIGFVWMCEALERRGNKSRASKVVGDRIWLLFQVWQRLGIVSRSQSNPFYAQSPVMPGSRGRCQTGKEGEEKTNRNTTSSPFSAPQGSDALPFSNKYHTVRINGGWLQVLKRFKKRKAQDNAEAASSHFRVLDVPVVLEGWNGCQRLLKASACACSGNSRPGEGRDNFGFSNFSGAEGFGIHAARCWRSLSWAFEASESRFYVKEGRKVRCRTLVQLSNGSPASASQFAQECSRQRHATDLCDAGTWPVLTHTHTHFSILVFITSI